MTRVLFVDDEPTIRLTLPKILEMHEFQVMTAGSVAEALKLIQSEKFDVLLSDLNIGEQSDGFTVVSAMRRLQPEALTIIITGYPAFETALEAIRQQVDDYIAKPADVDELITTIKNKLTHRTKHVLEPKRRIAAILAANSGAILKMYVAKFRKSLLPEKFHLNDDEIKNDLPAVLEQITQSFELFEGVTATAKSAAQEHGRVRQRQGFRQTIIIDEIRLIRAMIFRTVQQNILAVDVSYLIPDMIRISENLDVLLKEALEAYVSQDEERDSEKIA